MTSTKDFLDPATHPDKRFPKHGEFDTAYIKGEDIPVTDVEDTQALEPLLDRLLDENAAFRVELENARRRVTNQRRELRRLAKLDAQHQTELRVEKLRRENSYQDFYRIRKDLQDRLAEARKLYAETREELLKVAAKVPAQKKKGFFRR